MQPDSNNPGIRAFLRSASDLLCSLASKNAESLEECAARIAKNLDNGGRLFGFGCGHSGLISQDSYYRAGGLKEFTHIFAPRVELDQDPVAQSSVEEKTAGWIEAHLSPLNLGKHDTVIVISTSGVNAVPVEAALHVKERGALLVAVTSVEASQAIPPRHESGKRLLDIADVVLDNLSPYGDVLVQPKGHESGMGSASTAAGSLLLQALMVGVQEAATGLGSPRPSYVSGNIPGGMERNAED